MVVQWLRESRVAAGAMLLLRIWLGYTWLVSGWEKITGGFQSAGFLKGAVAKATGEHPAVQGWWASFIKSVALPNSGLFDFLIPWGEFLVGVALLLGLFTTFAGLMGIIMNFAFLFSGTTSINPQMVLFTTFILVAGRNAGHYGLDTYVLPLLDRWMGREQQLASYKDRIDKF
ncbi:MULTISPECIES: DoxX family membrane protein [Aneurinibacillus]|uniref:DoxX family membrane protein n=1 Tax=Aneurinibacillus thermoaerophilus TaxID=143495 RepID=A0A1G8BXH7_ANETH|nr:MULTISPECIES: DoxX family membrane protein [Aneurinibacillus]AMA71990.1 Crp/Fnr family transcriptional regulator [Aneurinibacillus sp. XH2]MED0675120.1 DoxX family membrane protein [Aneurinibacillus thermoaerophilus]MED0679269.1 DoxX family membrane protein [Aneurinibacillus thermoaerophilus]MED0737155.1 DoxX family membrane protein [Aneurinibacillus thermoaerophilus]MED0757201.1 DoxX family membrane protein [Aneurinibacillus thermoaerophilus]